jgi:predicted CxxxxCH...CXXCH cytochrome family protein
MPRHQDLTEAECQGCHGDNGTAPGYQRCVVCHGVPPPTGAHGRHLALAGLAITCDTCHAGAGIDHADRHRDGTVDVALDPRLGGSFAAGSCSGVSCHGIGTPRWLTDTSLGCTACHDPQGTVAIGPRSGQHASHIARGFVCSTCHAAPPPTHFNGRLDNPTGIVPDGGAYRDDTPNGYVLPGTSGSCSGLGSPCHGGNAHWSQGEGCEACHGTPTSPSHPRHVSAADTHSPCSYCHASWPAEHVNGRVDVVFDRNARPGNATYRAGVCSIYCHGSGGGPLPPAGGAAVTPTWGGRPRICGDCHGAPGAVQPYPPTGKHMEHVSWYGRVCADCHARWPQQHGDGVRTIAFGAPAGPAVFARAPQPNTGTCAMSQCHFDFPADVRTWIP